MKKIKLTQGKYALVDDGDFDYLSQKKWYLTGNKCGSVYAMTFENNKNIGMHRMIMGNPKGLQVDHKNGDTLDNRRGNLRICSVVQNAMNRKLNKNNKSGYKGVFYYDYLKKPWGAFINIYGMKRKWLGSYSTKELARDAYMKYAIKIDKDFAFNGTRLDKSAL